VSRSDYLQGLFVFDPVELAWSDISNKAIGDAPAPRKDFGFASADGKLFVHGGYNPLGNVFALTRLARNYLRSPFLLVIQL
jgi:hypothetical protein